jgi:hypothetical protein
MNAFIDKVTTEFTGGGSPVDFITLKSGRVLGISDDCVVLYENMQDFWDMETKSRQCIDLYSEAPTSWNTESIT